MIQTIEKRLIDGGALTLEETLLLAATPHKEELYEAAHRITRHFMGDAFDTCSIINAKSGNCPEDCKWCAQSRHYATTIEKYGLLSPEICAEQAEYNRRQGIGRFSLVASGRTASMAEIHRMAASYRAIKEKTDIKCCASLGLLSEEKLQILFDHGVTTYHCNMETAPSFFPTLCSTHTQDEKLDTIRAARRVGMRVCSGGIIGMGESMEQRIEFAFFLRSIDVYSIPINILQPIAGTPLEHTPPLTEEEYLTTVALFRLINPRAFLRFSGGRAQLSPEVQRKAIHIGINAAITGDLLTTTGSKAAEDMELARTCGMRVTNQTDWEVSYDH
ncbi:biotin synthase BioB [Porphyromonas loveana]|uniref:biotin synthase BioB n=1 Tax=Porphyromonas loveana TaxID=1884669 RepID=UPI00359F612F